jgi:hypothetical protein
MVVPDLAHWSWYFRVVAFEDHVPGCHDCLPARVPDPVVLCPLLIGEEASFPISAMELVHVLVVTEVYLASKGLKVAAVHLASSPKVLWDYLPRSTGTAVPSVNSIGGGLSPELIPKGGIIEKRTDSVEDGEVCPFHPSVLCMCRRRCPMVFNPLGEKVGLECR